MYKTKCDECKKEFQTMIEEFNSINEEFNSINDGVNHAKNCAFDSFVTYDICPYCDNYQNYAEYHTCVDLNHGFHIYMILKTSHNGVVVADQMSDNSQCKNNQFMMMLYLHLIVDF